MPKSVLEAIKLGIWNFEPETVNHEQFEPTDAPPGSPEKISVLAQRLQQGLPLWHPRDRQGYDAEEEDLWG